MRCIRGESDRSLPHGGRDLVEVLEVDAAHRLTDPVDGTAGGNREADVVETLHHLGRDVVGPVLVAHHADNGHAVPCDGAVLVVGLGDEGVESFQHHLTDARRMPEPDGGGEHEDLRVEDGCADGGPAVAVSLVGRDPEAHALVDDAERGGGLDVVAGELVTDQLDHALGARRLRCRFQRAVERDCTER